MPLLLHTHSQCIVQSRILHCITTAQCIVRCCESSLCIILQAKQREQSEFEQRAARIQKLEARQKQQEEAAVKALGQQLLAHQVSLPSHQSAATLFDHPAQEVFLHKVSMMSPCYSFSWCLTHAIS